MKTYLGGKKYLRDNRKMNIKTDLIRNTLKVLTGLAIMPVLALMVVATITPESTKAA